MRVVLVGNPNSGKTTLFNSLTGSTQKVGNWPGVTIAKKEGVILGNHDLQLTDLPGIYSLTPYTLEETITRQVLVDEKVDCIINIIDAANMERNLYLTSQLMDLQVPMILVLNMMDVVKKRGQSIDLKGLSMALGYPVIEMVAVKNQGIEKIVPLICKSQEMMSPVVNWFDAITQGALNNIQTLAKCNEFMAIKLFEKDAQVVSTFKLSEEQQARIDSIIKETESKLGDDCESIIVTNRYRTVDKIVAAVMVKPKGQLSWSEKIDRVVMNKWLGIPIFLLIIAFIYYVSITTVGELTTGWIEGLVVIGQNQVEGLLNYLSANPVIIRLLVDGIIGSIGAFLVFIPQLMILFFFLAILEDSGYMSRIAVILDRIFRSLGLSGKSFIPMLVGTGCTTPGILAARSIENQRDKEMTILLTPFIPCGAKLPVFAMFISMMFPNQGWIGPIIYILPFGVIIVTGLILNKVNRIKGQASNFIIELPEYKLPHHHSVLIQMWDKVKDFIKRIGSIIFVAVVVMWFLQNFSPNLTYVTNVSDSMMAVIGNWLRVIFIPLGFGDSWAPAVASLSGVVAKEVVVTTFASISQTSPVLFSQVSAFSFVLFIALSAPCVSAISTMIRELGSIKKAMQAVAFQMGVAYGFSFVFYQVASRVLAGTKAVALQALDFGHVDDIASNPVLFSSTTIIMLAVVVFLAIYVMVVNQRIRNKIVKES